MDFKALPKAEIHIHLEGCFEPHHIAELAAEAGETLPRAPELLYDTSSLTNFLAFLDWVCGLVRTPDQLARAARNFAQRQKDSGVLYTDLILNPTHWHDWQRDLPALLDGLDRGFAQAEAEGCPPTALCISLLRQQSADEAMALVEELGQLNHPRVVALSVDGNEAAAGRTGTKFAAAFARAAELGLRRTTHAGESSGPEGVRDAIELLGTERLDHGIRAIEDKATLDLVIARGIPMGVTPRSNIALGLFPDYAAHPMERLRQAGVKVSLATDDPAPLRTSLEAEYAAATEAFGWSAETVREVARSSVTASFAPEALKVEILAKIDDWAA